MKKTELLFLMIIISFSTQAMAGGMQISWDFEQGSSMNNGVSGWVPAGGAGLDNEKNLAYRGKGNAWVRNTKGWNAINNMVTISAPSGSTCQAIAWLRTSDKLTDGYMTIRDGDKADGTGKILNEIKLTGGHDYRKEWFEFKMGSHRQVLFYVGLWGNGKDSWIQIDDASIFCKLPDPQ